MKRRRALQALLAVPAVRAQDTSSIVITSADAIGSAKLNFFTAHEMEKLRGLAAKIVPGIGGRPGASEAGAAEFLDYLLSRSGVGDQKLYRQGLAAVSSLDLLEQSWSYTEPKELSARFLRRLKEDVLRATFNSHEWISASGRRGGGTNYYWKPIE